MLRNLIILPDGTEISSGVPDGKAIIEAQLTQCVNDGAELTIGSVCSNELELKLFSGGGLAIAAGDEIQHYKVGDSGTRTKTGVFRCEKPTITSPGTYKVLAYDNISRLDKDLTEWLAALDGWPYTVSTFARMVCEACGLTLAVIPTINAGYEIRGFSGSDVTGRMLMQWLGQIACSFIRANTEGEIEFSWYADKGAEVTTSGEFAYFSGGLAYEDYRVEDIQKVQIQVSDDDNGTIYPDGNEEELNTYKITGNYLLTAETGDELKPVAQAIYERLNGNAYTPSTVTVQATTDINAGDIVHVTDRNNVRITVFVMSKSNKGQKDTLECTGSYKRSSSTATNNVTLKALYGKVLNIIKSVDGLRIENKDTAGKIALIEANVDEISTTVSDANANAEEAKTQATQNAQEILLRATVEEVDSKVSGLVKNETFEEYKQAQSAELSVMSDKVTIAVEEKVRQEVKSGDDELRALYNELRMNYDFTSEGQFIGKPGSDTKMKLVNDMMQILVASVAATTVDKTGLTADQANIKTLHMGSYTLAYGNDGHLTLT